MREHDAVGKTYIKIFIKYWRPASKWITIIVLVDKLVGGFDEFSEW